MKATVLVIGGLSIETEMLFRQSSVYRLITADTAEEAAEKIKTESADVILIENILHNADCFKKCKLIKTCEGTRYIPAILLLEKNDLENTGCLVDCMADDFIVKPTNYFLMSQRIKCCIRLSQTVNSLNAVKAKSKNEFSALEDVTIMALAAFAETRDNSTGEHINRTRLYVHELADYLKDNVKYKEILTKSNITAIVKASSLHDIGKVGIPDSILLKPAALTYEEFEIMKTHTVLGLNAINSVGKILGSDTPLLRFAKEIIYSHHERWNGSGYPQGLIGEQIPASAQLMSIADVYDALTSRRVYKEAFSHEKAVEIISAGENKHFAPEIISAFLSLEKNFKEISEYVTENVSIF